MGDPKAASANHKSIRQKEIEYYDLMAKRADLILKKLQINYEECNILFKMERVDYQSPTECQKRAEEYSEREMKR